MVQVVFSTKKVMDQKQPSSQKEIAESLYDALLPTVYRLLKERSRPDESFSVTLHIKQVADSTTSDIVREAMKKVDAGFDRVSPR